jgi:DNA polymerase III epsilon subunit-like protein
MSRIVAIDTETTSLRADRRAWEIGLIIREPGQPDTEHLWHVAAEDLDLGNADLMSLKIGRFHERHPQYALGAAGISGLPDVTPEPVALHEIEAITRGAHLVGAVVSFDAEVLGNRMRAHGICPSWHHHLIDVEALAVGWLNGNASGYGHKDRPLGLCVPPWKSDDLSAALGVTVSDDDRHTALGDARWALRVYDAVMGGTP